MLCRPDCRLLVIGYGFGDAHVNEVICEAIFDSGMKVVVSNRMSYEQLREDLKDVSLPENTKLNLGNQSAREVILSATHYIEKQPITEFYDNRSGVTETGRQLLNKLKVLNY